MMNKWLVLLVIFALIASDVDAKNNKKMKKKKSSGGMNVFHNDGPFFSLPVKIGSQKTKLNVGVDGYYGATVIYGAGVACDGSDSYCVEHATFDRSDSDTFIEHDATRHFEFSLGTAEGLAGSDTLSVGSLTLEDTMFGIAESIPNHLNRKTKNSGHIAMQSPEKKDEDKATMQKLVEQAPEPTVTFHAPMDMHNQHTITIGSDDTSNCKNNWITFDNQKTLDPKHSPWTINWSGFKWGSYSKMEKMNVALNPSADYFVAPKRHASYIYKTLGARHSSGYSGGMVDCSKRNSAPNLEFTVKGGKKLTISPKQYIKMFDSSNCLLNIYPDELNLWTMPYMFFQKYCVKFDYGKSTICIADQK